MSIMDGCANNAEKLQRLNKRELMPITVLINRDAFNELHNKIRQTVFSGTAIQELRDIGMTQSSENLSLMTEMVDYTLATQARSNQFDRNLFLILRVGAFGPIDLSHAAAADLAEQPVWPHQPTSLGAASPSDDCRRNSVCCRLLHKTTCQTVVSDQSLDLMLKRLIT